MLYTSRYANKELLNKKYMAVRISIGIPKWKLGYDLFGEINELMPYGLFNVHDHEIFKQRYYKRLDSFGVERIRERLDYFRNIAEASGKDVVLLCYEDVRKGPPTWCHRIVFAEWWKERTGEIIRELSDYSLFTKNGETAAKPKFEDIPLF